MTGSRRAPSPPTPLTEAEGRPPGNARGFTLVELLVAIWILAVVSIIAWRGLSALVATRDRLAPETDEVRALLTGFGQMERDLAQAANPVLISLGGSPVQVLVIDGAQALEILRLSQPLPDGASAVQRVVYLVIDGALLRQCSPPERSVQAALNTSPSTARLVPGVTSMHVRVWRPTQGWVVPAQTDPATPAGVEVDLTRSDGTHLRRVLLVG